jgi:hypothetical protein
VEIIAEHGQDVQMFMNDQHGQIIITTGRTVETGAAARPGGLGTATWWAVVLTDLSSLAQFILNSNCFIGMT